MRPHSLIFAQLAAASAILPSEQILFKYQDDSSTSDYRIPTVQESAVMARRMLRYERIGTLSTIFPNITTNENRPSSVAGSPLGLMESTLRIVNRTLETLQY
jgi:hypothetical protein